MVWVYNPRIWEWRQADPWEFHASMVSIALAGQVGLQIDTLSQKTLNPCPESLHMSMVPEKVSLDFQSLSG